MRTSFCISSSIWTIDFNFVSYIGWHKIWIYDVIIVIMWLASAIYRPDRKWAQISHLKFYLRYSLQTLSDMLEWQKNYIHDIKWLSRYLNLIYRPDKKWGQDLASQVLKTLLTSNFVRYVGVTKITSMTSSWWSRDLGTIYRQDRK